MATALSYPAISGVSNPPYLSALSETANIQNTINFLYYGSSDSGVTPRTTLSTSGGIYGMLQQLQTQISSLQSGINVHENARYATAATITGTYSAGSADNSATPGTGLNAYITFTATGVQSIDGGASLILGDRVLVKDGTTIGAAGTTSSIANGIYVVQSNGIGGQSTLTPTFSNGSATTVVLVRSADANNSSPGDFAEGDFLYVAEGSTNASKSFMLTAAIATGGDPVGTIQIGTNPALYNQFIGVGSYYIGTTAAQITSANQALTGISSIALPGPTSGTITLTPAATAGTTAITIPAVAGTLAINPTTTIGDIIYASATGTPGTLARLAGNTATQTSFLASTGNGTANTTTSFISSTGTAGTNVVLATSPTITTPTIDIINAAASSSVTSSLFNNVTTGTVGVGTNVTTGNVNIGTSATSGVIRIGTGTALTGDGSTTGLILIGNGANTATTKTITIGNAGTGGTTNINLGTSGATGTQTVNAYGTFKIGGTTTIASGVAGIITLPSTAGTLALLGANTFTGTQTLVTGTTTVAPLRIPQSTQANLLASPLANAIESSVEGFYATVSATPGRGLVRAEQIIINTANSTASTGSVASVFGKSLTLEANKIYRFKAMYYPVLTYGTSSATISINFLFGNAPQYIKYNYTTLSSTSSVALGYQTATTSVNVGGTITSSVSYAIVVEGTFATDAVTGGTFTPQFTSTGTGVSTVMSAGTWLEINKIGAYSAGQGTILAGTWA